MRLKTKIAGYAVLLSFLAPGMVSAQEPSKPALEDKLTTAAEANRTRLYYNGTQFSGPAWDKLVAEGHEAQFFLIGEEHGIAENPKLAASLFKTLAASGYSKLAIEVSPPMAKELDTAAADGIAGIKDLFSELGGEPAFFGMKEEAELLVSARQAVPGSNQMLWGLDYEVLGDPQLLATLAAANSPEQAKLALAALTTASQTSWAKYRETRGPQYIFSFSADPQLVRDVKSNWPERSPEVNTTLTTLEETLEINRLFVTGQNWQSNARRGALLRRNFLTYWRAEKAAGNTPKVMAKFGASHMVRGRSYSETLDLGALLPEIAALEGGTSFSMLVLPGRGSNTAVFDPTRLKYVPAPAKDGYGKNIEAITNAAYADSFTLIDLRPLRPLVGNTRSGASPAMMRLIHGFDTVLVLSGSTPSAELDHPDPLEN